VQTGKIGCEKEPQTRGGPRWFAKGDLPHDSGEVKTHHELFALLNKVYSARLTGQLQMVLGRVERQLFFDGGQLVFASSSDRFDSLGEMMLREGAITQAQFEEASELMKTGQRFGSALAEMEVLSVGEIADWIQRQLTLITISVLNYRACRFYFFGGLDKNVVPDVAIAVPLGRLLLDVVRVASDLPLEELAADTGLRVTTSQDPLLRYQAVELNESERKLLGCADQDSSFPELVAHSGLSIEVASRALYALLVLGEVVCVDRAPDEEAEREVARRERAEVRNSPQPRPAQSPAPRGASKGESTETPSSQPFDAKQFEQEIRSRLVVASKSTYYELLGVTATSPLEQVRENFHGLARKFHPDRHMGRSELLGLLQDLMGRLTLAYKTLMDDQLRAAYDKEIASAGAFDLGKEKSEAQETVEECFNRAKQAVRAKNFAGSIFWLRKCVEIAPDVAKYHAMLARSLGAIPAYRKDAVHHFKMALELDPWNTSACYQFGELYELLGLPWRAVDLYRRVLEIDPQHAKAMERLAALDEAKKPADKSFISRIFRRKK
jgi:tetratricopeptide (TPR) repeat protein